ncbi:hypothetical protein J4558_08420 [Leptolyngbya sp. 15MV]|nr:hypothetical protein J4558_08420 [Leptolyngbya sp. 15MV]
MTDDLAELNLYEDAAPRGFAARLQAGRAPPSWLVPVDLDLPDGVRVWRVLDSFSDRRHRPAPPPGHP